MSTNQRIAVLLVFVVAVVGGGIVAAAVLGGASPVPSSAATASSSAPAVPAASAIASPTAAASTPAPTVAPTAGATPTPTVAPTAAPVPTTAPGPAATIVLTQLKLDAKDDPSGRDRLVTFTTGGTGTVTITLGTTSPMGGSTMCLAADGRKLGCKEGATGRLTAKTTKPAASFELTLRGLGIEAPVVAVTITFPATRPSVTVANARFDGTAFPETNGIQAVVRARADGDVRLTADWGGHPFLYEVDLFEQDGSGSQVLANQGPATRMAASLRVTATNPWKVLLQNIEMGFGATPMVVTIAWP